MSAEEDFYRNHYGQADVLEGDYEKEAARSLSPGQRYHLVSEVFSQGIDRAASVIELGCGGGGVLRYLAKAYGLTKAEGLDVVFDGPREKDGVRFRPANLNTDWPVESGSVDHLIAMMVFEHLFDPFHSFAETARVLSRTGKAYVNLPLVTSIKNRARLALGLLPSTSVPYQRWFEEGGWDGNHLHYFSMRSIRDLASACGLKVGNIRGVGSMHGLKSALPGFLASEVTFTLEKA